MNTADTKALAEEFRAIADDKAAVTALSSRTKTANVGNTAVEKLCARFDGAADGAAVRAICDEVRDR